MREEILAEGVRVICGDCREILPKLGKVDAVVTDPPYGIDIAKRGTIGTSKKGQVKDYGASDWDAEPISAETVKLIQDCSRYQIIFGGNFFELGPTPCWLVWDKQNTGDFADCELAWTNLRKAVRRIYWRWNGMIRKGSDERVHPTQKPVGVMRWCLEHLPDDARLICDPFAGSFTTGVACIREGKSFIGIEREPAYFEAGIKRLREALAAPEDMFAARPAAAATQEALL